MYTTTEIQQLRASTDAKLARLTYSSYLKELYGLAKYCGCHAVHTLLLLRFALNSWDTREGASNVLSAEQLGSVVKGINSI